MNGSVAPVCPPRRPRPPAATGAGAAAGGWPATTGVCGAGAGAAACLPPRPPCGNVQNGDNNGYGFEYLSRLTDIETAVAGGMVLVIHDRYVDDAESILPGGGSFEIIRNFDDDANIDVLDDTTFEATRGTFEVRIHPRTVRMLALP